VYVALKDQGETNYAIAEKLGVDESSVRRGLKAAGFKPYLIPPSWMEKLAVQMDVPYNINVSTAGPGAITADWHIPLTDFGLVNEFLDHAVDIGATNWLGIAGDFWNQDFFSQFDFKQKSASFDRELFAGSEVIRRVLQVFDCVVLSYGNHDARLLKTVGYAADFVTTMEWLFHDLTPEEKGKLFFSNLDYFEVDTPRGKYRLCHPKAYSSQPLSNGRKLASKYLCHVVTGHSHHTALGHDVSGQFTVAEIGGFFDASKTQYLQRSTAFPNWQNGYGFINTEGHLIIEGQGWSSRVGRRLD
jgi:hypothetical protein